MSIFGKVILFTGTSAAALYLGYKFLKCRNSSQDPTSDTAVGVLNDSEKDEISTNNVIGKNCPSEESLNEGNIEGNLLKEEVRAEGVKKWIDESVVEFYSENAGPSTYNNVKQQVWDHLMDSEIWETRNSENVNTYVKDYLKGERIPDIPTVSSSDVKDVVTPSPPNEESSSKNLEIEQLCNRFFGITYDEYQALEEERYLKIMAEESPPSTEMMPETSKASLNVNETRDNLKNISKELEEKNDKKVKEVKSKKKWKTRITNFFRRLKGSKNK